MKKQTTNTIQPISILTANRILMILVLALAVLAGYFHAKADTIQRKYELLEREAELHPEAR